MSDQSRLGLYFAPSSARTAVRTRVVTAPLARLIVRVASRRREHPLPAPHRLPQDRGAVLPPLGISARGRAEKAELHLLPSACGLGSEQ